jgi:hypothetical protein
MDEVNLRYTDVRERRCPCDHDLSAFFPILRHQSLNGCELGRPSPRGGVIYDPLVCHGAGGMKGTAQLNEAADSILGELKIQMGGKHLTFSQRVEATRRGDCNLQC